MRLLALGVKNLAAPLVTRRGYRKGRNVVRAADTETHYSLLNFNGHFPTAIINM
jgi:hypothetical protein